MKKITLVISAALLMTSFLSCKKYGCTDPDAVNFEDKVRSNNLLCQYEGSITFWYDKITKDSLKALYAFTSLEYFVDEERIDSLEFNNELEKPPSCSASGVASHTDSMSTGNKRWVEYFIYTDTDILLYDSIVELTANECLKIKLD